MQCINVFQCVPWFNLFCTRPKKTYILYSVCVHTPILFAKESVNTPLFMVWACVLTHAVQKEMVLILAQYKYGCAYIHAFQNSMALVLPL